MAATLAAVVLAISLAAPPAGANHRVSACVPLVPCWCNSVTILNHTYTVCIPSP